MSDRILQQARAQAIIQKGTIMSHFTSIKTQIKDIEALRSAVKEMDLELIANTDARGFYQNKIKGDFVIRLKGPFDIAVNK